mmetsp:Transcript_19819/g.25167  ORF Transcript_19819/g.25167 Transcript_19819/m.25167 type:complete len:122 (-) Transcript_19819:605-970(-)
MIERHYFRSKLIKSYDFSFDFCIPGSTNTWDAVYDVPPLDDDLIDEMIKHPHETTSDSFYFVDGALIMHNKASYQYVKEDCSKEKRSYQHGCEAEHHDVQHITRAMSEAKCASPEDPRRAE